MNKSLAVFLVSDDVTAVGVSYELKSDGEPVGVYSYKTFDKTLKKGDFVIVPTDTRHKMTVVRIEEIDVEIDMDSTVKYKWIIGKIGCIKEYEGVLKQETEMLEVVKSAEKMKKRRELREAMMEDAGEKLTSLPIYTVGDTQKKN